MAIKPENEQKCLFLILPTPIRVLRYPFLRHQNQLRGLLQVPPLEVAGSSQLGIIRDDGRGPDSASWFPLVCARTSHRKSLVIHRGYAEKKNYHERSSNLLTLHSISSFREHLDDKLLIRPPPSLHDRF